MDRFYKVNPSKTHPRSAYTQLGLGEEKGLRKEVIYE